MLLPTPGFSALGNMFEDDARWSKAQRVSLLKQTVLEGPKPKALSKKLLFRIFANKGL